MRALAPYLPFPTVKPAATTLALDPLPTPTRLVFTHVTSSSVHLSWTPASYPPLKYLIVWQPSRGGAPKEVRGGPLVQPLLRSWGRLQDSDSLAQVGSAEPWMGTRMKVSS